ncbi:UNVERIFIED_CONTAM: hypothetical protein RMT77_010387 [Armadillidium vulgare]
MNSLFHFFWIFQLFFGKFANSLEDCNPYTKCAEYTEGRKVRDPTNCHNYYVCITDTNGNIIPSSSPFQCPVGEYFAQPYQECRVGSCSNDCFNICPLECTSYEGERVDDPTNCSNFYICIPGNLKIKSQCPPELPYFDGKTCSPNSLSCCDSCVPYCDKYYREVRDPFSCTNYYYCLRPGEATYLYSCPAGQYFNSSFGRCLIENPKNPCVPICGSKE